METKKEKIAIGYILFVGVIAIALLSLIYFESNANENTLNDLKIEYGVDESNGDVLVQCVNGSLDVYRPTDMLPMVCGNIIRDEPVREGFNI